METALVPDGRRYSVAEFTALSADSISRLRHELKCPGCGRNAFFRRASIDGRAACFGALHDDGCAFDRSHEQPVEAPHTPGRRQAARAAALRVLREAADGRRLFLDTGLGTAPSGARVLSLAETLEYALHAPDFAQSSAQVQVGDHPRWTLGKLLVPVESISAEHEGQYRGYFGLITAAVRPGDHKLWLNTGTGAQAFSALSVMISAKARIDALLEDAKAGSAEDLVGRHFLVLARLQRSQHGKPYLEPAHSRQIALL